MCLEPCTQVRLPFPTQMPSRTRSDSLRESKDKKASRQKDGGRIRRQLSKEEDINNEDKDKLIGQADQLRELLDHVENQDAKTLDGPPYQRGL